MADVTVVSPLRIEALAVGGPVRVIGMGRKRASASGRRMADSLSPGAALALAGVAGALAPDLVPGQLVVASEVRSLDGRETRLIPSAELAAAELRRSGLEVRVGPVVSSSTLVRGDRRRELAATGALAVDMESSWLLEQVGDRPVCVVRSISDSQGRGLVSGGLRALGSLRKVRPALDRWAAAAGPRTLLLAAPRSFCAGVERAIEIVDRALDRHGPPVYVRRQIVHNAHVVGRLESRGAVFVEELDQIPDHATVVIAAHGVTPAVRAEAHRRSSLSVIDATCPLVAKVHHEARRFLSEDFRIALIGHRSHEEVEGTLGEDPQRITVVERTADVADLSYPTGTKLAYLTQTTLATDETAEIIEALRDRFPDLDGPASSDICYATQNRQDSVRNLAGVCDLVLVIGSTNSSNTARLVEVARREGCRTELIEDAGQLELGWLSGAGTIGLTAGASVPEDLVQEVVASLSTLGPLTVHEHRTMTETAHFSLPRQVR